LVSESKFRGKKYFTPVFKFTSTHSNNSSKYDISTGHIDAPLDQKMQENVMQYFPGKEVLAYPENVKYPWAAL